MTMFSGSIYLLVLDPQRFKVMGPITPLGGVALIGGWVALAVGSRGRIAMKWRDWDVVVSGQEGDGKWWEDWRPVTTLAAIVLYLYILKHEWMEDSGTRSFHRPAS
jgi:hypothetical protein